MRYSEESVMGVGVWSRIGSFTDRVGLLLASRDGAFRSLVPTMVEGWGFSWRREKAAKGVGSSDRIKINYGVTYCHWARTKGIQKSGEKRDVVFISEQTLKSPGQGRTELRA